MVLDRSGVAIEQALFKIGKAEIDWDVCTDPNLFFQLVLESLKAAFADQKVKTTKSGWIELSSVFGKNKFHPKRLMKSLTSNDLERNAYLIRGHMKSMVDIVANAATDIEGELSPETLRPILTIHSNDDRVAWQFFDNLMANVIVSSGTSSFFVTRELAAAMGLTPGQTRERAMANLRELMEKPADEGFLVTNTQGSIWPVDGPSACALLMIDEFWRRQQEIIDDIPFVHVISQHTFMFTGESDQISVDAIKKAAINRTVPSAFGPVWFILDPAGLRVTSTYDLDPEFLKDAERPAKKKRTEKRKTVN